MKHIKLFEQYNEHYDDNGKWTYYGNCVNYNNSDELEQIINNSEEIPYKSFLNETKIKDHYLNTTLFPIYNDTGRLKIGNDWSVRFFKSKYKNPKWIDISELEDEEEIEDANYENSKLMEFIPVYYIQHSAIEYVFKKI